LGKLGYKEKKTGTTFGSKKASINEKLNHIIRIHKPHPKNELKRYVRIYIMEELSRQNLI